MFPIMFAARACGYALVSSLLFALPTMALQSPVLSLHEAIYLAETQAPLLRAATAHVQAKTVAQTAADRLPDPSLIVGVDNLPIEGADKFSVNADFMTMRRIGVMQEFPNADLRAARVQEAQAQLVLSRAEQQLQQRELRTLTALQWLRTGSAQQKLQLINTVLQEQNQLERSVSVRFGSGLVTFNEVLMAQQESALLANQRDDIESKLAQSQAQLRALIGNDADRALSVEWPHWQFDAVQLQQSLQHHPLLQQQSAREHAVSAEIKMAQADKQSDWALELAYQKRGDAFGDMIMAQVRVDLPLFSRQRHDPHIYAKQAEHDAVLAEREAVWRQQIAEVQSLLLAHTSSTKKWQRWQQILLPLAQQQYDLQRATFDSGKPVLSELLMARRNRVQVQIAALEQQLEQAEFGARLQYFYGNNEIGTQP